MARSDDYRLLHDLVLDPETVHILTIGEERYLTDHYVIVCLTRLPDLRYYALADVPDGVYRLRRTQPPQRCDRSRLSVPKTIKLLNRFANVDDWRPVKATRWATVGESVTRILARYDAAGIAPTGVRSELWDRWHARLTSPHTRSRLHAYQPESRPAHAIRIDLSYTAGRSSSYAPITAATTLGYLMPIQLSGVDEEAIRFLCERFAAAEGAGQPHSRLRSGR